MVRAGYHRIFEKNDIYDDGRREHRVIIAGFIGVGKSRATSEWQNCVNIELSPLYRFQPEYPPGRQLEESKELRQYILNPLYPYNAILKILEAEASNKYVIINAVKSILTPLAEEYQRRCVLVYPDISLREEYRRIYRQRGNNDAFVCRIMDEWDSRLQFLDEFDCGSVHLHLRSSSCHLSDMKASLDKLWESAQPPVSPETLHELEQKIAAASISYSLVDSQNRYTLSVDLRSPALQEYLCRVVVEDMPRPTLTRCLPDNTIQVGSLEEFIEVCSYSTAP